MAVGAFPIAKLAYLAIKQISKPIANQLKNAAKSNRTFRRYVCLPPAQFYHFVETTFKLYIMGFGKPVKVPPLNEQMAVELGAELLGEGIVFVAAAATIFFEYRRQARNTKIKEEELEERMEHFQKQLELLYDFIRQQDERTQELHKQLNSSMLRNFAGKLGITSDKKPDVESVAPKLLTPNKPEHEIAKSKSEKNYEIIFVSRCNKYELLDLSFIGRTVRYACALILGKAEESGSNISNDKERR